MSATPLKSYPPASAAEPTPIRTAAAVPFRLEAVIVCVNYGDILAHTLPDNRILFDRIVVVTAPEDKETRRVCEYWHIQCIPTDVTHSRWGKFCKGAAINEGLKALDQTDLVVHMDADIALPPLTRKLIEGAELDRSFIYGCDRVMCRSFSDWAKFRCEPRLQHEDECWIHMNQFPFGHRVAIHSYGGYIPIGFFQMWSPSASGIRDYPEGHTTGRPGRHEIRAQVAALETRLAAGSDRVSPRKRGSAHGGNWSGRTTRPFRPV